MRCLSRPLVLVLVPALLTACAIGKRDFDCPGMPDGAICKSPQEVYKLTNNADRVQPDGSDGQSAAAVKSAATASALVPKTMVEPITQPMPVLEPAQTMRAWIAPWIDKRGDLHFPSLLFTEVTPRRWALGEAAGREARILVPLAVDSSAGNRLIERFEEEGAGRSLPSAPSPGAMSSPSGLPGIPGLPSSLPPGSN